MNITIPTLKPAYVVDGQTVTELIISAINFKVFCDIVEKASSTDEHKTQRALFRERAKAQVKCTLSTGLSISMTDALLNKMPIHYAMRLKDAVNESMLSGDPLNAPKLLGEGDGIATAIHLKLGIPIKFQGDKPPITELEFRADVFEDLEDAILADNRVQQVLALMKIAKPVDGPGGLTALPSWAIDQLSFEDGMFIASQILPNFTGGQLDS